MTDTKLKGLTTELQCQLYFTQLGYNVSVPLGEDCKYDFILDVNSKLLRIQVKTCTIEKTGLTFSCKSIYLLKSRVAYGFYTKEDIDFFCTFYQDKCYLIPVEICGKSSKKLSFKKEEGVLQNNFYLYDYEAEEILDKIKKNLPYYEIKKYKIGQYSLEGKLIQIFNSCQEAYVSLGKQKTSTSISRCINQKRKTAYGYIWKIIETE